MLKMHFFSDQDSKEILILIMISDHADESHELKHRAV